MLHEKIKRSEAQVLVPQSPLFGMSPQCTDMLWECSWDLALPVTTACTCTQCFINGISYRKSYRSIAGEQNAQVWRKWGTLDPCMANCRLVKTKCGAGEGFKSYRYKHKCAIRTFKGTSTNGCGRCKAFAEKLLWSTNFDKKNRFETKPEYDDVGNADNSKWP